MVGLIISWWIAGLGALIALAFAFLWVRDLTAGTALAHTPEVPPESPTGANIPANEGPAAMPLSPSEERYPRSKFLEISTLGLGGVIGAVPLPPVSAPQPPTRRRRRSPARLPAPGSADLR